MAAPGPFQRDDCFPSWTNKTLFLQGQRFFANHRGAMGLLETLTLGGFLAIHQNSDVLLFTATNDCPAKSNKRYTTTTKQILLWGLADIGNDSQNPYVITRSMNHVRNVHKHAGERVRAVYAENGGNLGNEARFDSKPLNTPVWNAFQQDLVAAVPLEKLQFPSSYTQGLASYTPLNQFQYAATQWSFMFLPTKKVFLPDSSDEDIRALNHWWAVAGNMMGIEDRFNAALHPDLASTQKYYQDFFEFYVLPSIYHLSNVSKYFMELTLERASSIEIPVLNYTLPSIIPLDGAAMGFISLAMNKSYDNLWAIASPEGKAFVKMLEAFNSSGASVPGFHPALNVLPDGQTAYWGTRDFGVCYPFWVTQCQVASSVHYWYQGPNKNPDGVLGCSVDGEYTCY